MKICHVIGGIDPADGGPTAVAMNLTALQARRGHDVALLAYEQPDARERIEAALAVIDGSERVRRVFLPAGRFGLTDRRFRGELETTVAQADVVHMHGVWEPSLVGASRFARRSGIPYVLRTAGMLLPWSLSRKAWKKRIALALLYRRMIEGARVIHVTARAEAQSVRGLGIPRPLAVIPSGMDLAPFGAARPAGEVERRWPALTDRKRLLFLSRLHSGKGLLHLARAWGRVAPRHRDWHLVIAGPDVDGHRGEVERRIRDAGVAEATTFTGALYGDEKYAMFSACDLFVLPSESENFGVAVAEALAAGLPVITTTGTPWSDLVEQRCGWYVELEDEPLERALAEALALTAAQRGEMGLRGRELCERRYSLDAMARQVEQLYAWVGGASVDADFIFGEDQPVP